MATYRATVCRYRWRSDHPLHTAISRPTRCAVLALTATAPEARWFTGSDTRLLSRTLLPNEVQRLVGDTLPVVVLATRSSPSIGDCGSCSIMQSGLRSNGPSRRVFVDHKMIGQNR